MQDTHDLLGDGARAAHLFPGRKILLNRTQACLPIHPVMGKKFLIFRGNERLAQKIAKEAVELAEQATRADATKPEYFSQLGIALSVRMGEMNFMQQAMVAGKMRKAFEKSIALDPKHVAGLIGLARYYANAPEIAGGSLEKAKEYADRVHELNPVLGQMEYANIAEKGEDYAGALAHLEAALKLKPDSASLLSSSGRLLAKLGKKDEARARFEAALKLKPDFEAAKKALAALDQPETVKG